jgi:hypothetical protein
MASAMQRWVEIEEPAEENPKHDLAGGLEKWRAKEVADTENEVDAPDAYRGVRRKRSIVLRVLREIEWSRGLFTMTKPETCRLCRCLRLLVTEPVCTRSFSSEDIRERPITPLY